ncbi:hypothetical protein JIG36_34370 [Actinoplanes sp. LDG1-06]|uniref:Ribbon-helix-helix protein CopG domain-containing protein n=1 Tax=Paractinoplanes ovalisporus TaxID=2810368 RepID=A0ABS2ALE1_9ACTN|nr:hypothetical protein [Actinoplanes ovalisporus]MBM2620600.1 hypothetical protein [Actinoplanes ovalisporus]
MAVVVSIDGLVDEFVSTTRRHGVEVERCAVEDEVRERLADIAERLGVSVDAVLRDYVRGDWGSQMALAVLAQIRDERLL